MGTNTADFLGDAALLCLLLPSAIVGGHDLCPSGTSLGADAPATIETSFVRANESWKVSLFPSTITCSRSLPRANSRESVRPVFALVRHSVLTLRAVECVEHCFAYR